ncbi:MAG: cyclopropane fatty acyl phospholipid synthase [Pseudoalteromonas sp.]|uniref:cyclopropane fatty acyl phospholipid synthase n=1 Tax=unclassified Pseudoalteromonas TaxID=194690 RepID=UPI003F99BB2F
MKNFNLLADLVASAGVSIGTDKHNDIVINDKHAFSQAVLQQGTLGLGESYMAGIWESEQLDDVFYKFLRADIGGKVKPLKLLPYAIKTRLFNLQKTSRAFTVGEQHYDLGNDLYQAMLDPRMTYTCGYWQDANNLEQAQLNKLDLICRKLKLEPGMTLLDIGCGWGSFIAYAAEHYGVKCTGCTISKQQVAWIKNKYAHLPLEFALQDYRSLEGQYDRIVSVGMFEHVGYKNFADYFKVAERCLKDHGLFLLHTIGKHAQTVKTDPWIDKYIFPNGYIPNMTQLVSAAEKHFVVEDLHNFGTDYDKTLTAWFNNFDQHWPQLSKRYNERFYRMWKYYLLSCAGAFRARDLQLWQWVLGKNGVANGYTRES